MDCIFCRIIAGEIPCLKVYEDDDVLAFLDIQPVNPGHALVIPKKHFEDLLSVPAEVVESMMRVIKKITPGVIAGVDAKGFNLNLNNGSVSGQLVGHVHYHIVPRFEGDGRELWRGKEYGQGEAEIVLEKIKEKLSDL